MYQGFAVNSFLSSALFLAALALVVFSLRMAARHVLLTRRQDAERRHGPELISALLKVGGMLVVAFIILAILVTKVPAMSALDLAVNASFQPFRSPWLLEVFVLVTTFGTVIFASLTVASVSALLVWAGRLWLLLPLGVSFVGAELTTWATKYAVNRARPQFLDGIAELNPSFPSGHATASTVVLGFIGYLLASTQPTREQRVEVGFWFAMAVAAVCFSRLFLSLHYLSDVLAGVLVGGLWLLIGICICEWQKSRHSLRQPSRKQWS